MDRGNNSIASLRIALLEVRTEMGEVAGHLGRVTLSFSYIPGHAQPETTPLPTSSWK